MDPSRGRESEATFGWWIFHLCTIREGDKGGMLSRTKLTPLGICDQLGNTPLGICDHPGNTQSLKHKTLFQGMDTAAAFADVTFLVTCVWHPSICTQVWA